MFVQAVFFLPSFTVWPICRNEQNSPGNISPWSCCISLILNYQPCAHQTFLQQLPKASWPCQYLYWHCAFLVRGLYFFLSACRCRFPPLRSRAITYGPYICAMTLLPVYRTVRELNAHMGEPGWKQIISDWCFYWLQWGCVFAFHHCVGLLYRL